MKGKKQMKQEPLWRVKAELVSSFTIWAEKMDAEKSAGNFVEFLIQKKYLKGRYFNEFIDNIPRREPWVHLEESINFRGMIREGFLHPDERIGKKPKCEGRI